jgi:hypothetical protein
MPAQEHARTFEQHSQFSSRCKFRKTLPIPPNHYSGADAFDPTFARVASGVNGYTSGIRPVCLHVS